MLQHAKILECNRKWFDQGIIQCWDLQWKENQSHISNMYTFSHSSRSGSSAWWLYIDTIGGTSPVCHLITCASNSYSWKVSTFLDCAFTFFISWERNLFKWMPFFLWWDDTVVAHWAWLTEKTSNRFPCWQLSMLSKTSGMNAWNVSYIGKTDISINDEDTERNVD